MDLEWKYYLRLYAPFIALGLLNAVGWVYALGYKHGMSALNEAAANASVEAKTGESRLSDRSFLGRFRTNGE
jgi:hypothetical protein